jgi:ABC-type Fe3+/spermidine/putrescine transport system ATPase subunit
LQNPAHTTDCEHFAGLSVFQVYKSYGSQVALAGVSFQVARSEIVAVLGPSGCGKSTLLAVIAGLEKADQGEVCWEGASLAEVPTHKRGFGLMFQDFALFPHQDVFENIAFGLRMAGYPAEKIRGRVEEALELVGLPGFTQRDVNTLSGGEAQRIALARSLAPFPHLLMLDEPLGALDRTLRERLMMELGSILRHSQQTAIYVTHDQEEAFAVADRIILMNKGKVLQVGTPLDIYQQPGSVFAARFLGLNNILPGISVTKAGADFVETPLGVFPLPKSEKAAELGQISVLLRPDSVVLGTQGALQISGKVVGISFRGGTSRLAVSSSGLDLEFEFPSTTALPGIGKEITLSFDPAEALQILYE